MKNANFRKQLGFQAPALFTPPCDPEFLVLALQKNSLGFFSDVSDLARGISSFSRITYFGYKAINE